MNYLCYKNTKKTSANVKRKQSQIGLKHKGSLSQITNDQTSHWSLQCLLFLLILIAAMFSNRLKSSFGNRVSWFLWYRFFEHFSFTTLLTSHTDHMFWLEPPLFIGSLHWLSLTVHPDHKDIYIVQQCATHWPHVHLTQEHPLWWANI